MSYVPPHSIQGSMILEHAKGARVLLEGLPGLLVKGIWQGLAQDQIWGTQWQPH